MHLIGYVGEELKNFGPNQKICERIGEGIGLGLDITIVTDSKLRQQWIDDSVGSLK